MSINGNPNPAFEPLHKGHAIEQMVLAVNFDGEINNSVLGEIKKTFPPPPELPKRADMRTVMFAIGNVPTPRPSSPGVAGYSFSKFRENGVAEMQLRVERSAITFTTTQYTSWIQVWGQVRKYFEVLIPHYIPKISLSAIALSYVDKFIWTRADIQAIPEKLLKSNSPFLCPVVYKAQDLWHSHTGWFDKFDLATKRLLNVNVDFVDQEKDDEVRRTIVITTVLTDLLNQTDYDPSKPDLDTAVNFIEHHLDKLHNRCKEILSDIIDEEMSNRIALKQS